MLAGDRTNLQFDDVLAAHDGVAIAEFIAQGALSRAEVTEAAIARAEAANPILNALTCKTYDYARRRSATEPSGALSGVPTLIKDTDELKGFPVRVGSRATSDKPAEKTSGFVQQFEATGVVPIGISTTPEFGHAGTAEALLTGPTRNPWSLGHSSGGSSGGSAAFVAAGVAPLAHANDGAGSIRIPASACGLVGLKPSRGRTKTVDVPGVYPINIFHQGVVSRTVRDTVAVLSAIDSQSPSSEQWPALSNAISANAKPLKIAVYVDDSAQVRCDSQCAAAALAAAETCEGLGHHVELIRNPFDPSFDDDFWFCCWSFYLFVIKSFGRQVIGPGFKRDAVEPFTDYMASFFWKRKRRFFGARKRIRAFPQRYKEATSQYDVLLTPTLGIPIPELGYIGPQTDPAVFHERQLKLLPFTPAHNVSGAPSISLPMAMSSSGTPIGVMFSAQVGQDQLLLELALQLEAAGAFAPGLLDAQAR